MTRYKNYKKRVTISRIKLHSKLACSQVVDVVSLRNTIRRHILGFHMTSPPPCWCPKQREGGHVGAPMKSSGNLTLLLCKRFLLFSLKNMAVDHVSENQQLEERGIGLGPVTLNPAQT